MKDMRPAVYRLFTATDQLLYVGVGDSATARWDHHCRSKPWWQQVARATVVFYGSRQEALAEEARAIREELPLYNLAGTGKLFRKLGPPFAEGESLAAAAEIARRLAISRQRVQQVVSDPSFPVPYATISAGRIWLVEDIEKWIDATLRTFGIG